MNFDDIQVQELALTTGSEIQSQFHDTSRVNSSITWILFLEASPRYFVWPGRYFQRFPELKGKLWWLSKQICKFWQIQAFVLKMILIAFAISFKSQSEPRYDIMMQGNTL